MKKIKKRTIRAEDSKVFIGEMMVCRYCHKQQRSNPKKESGWTFIEVDDAISFYVCPECWNKGMGLSSEADNQVNGTPWW